MYYVLWVKDGLGVTVSNVTENLLPIFVLFFCC